jgi:exopolysaccharide biosynthesis polyprenyl glycosylphosphotransferase
MTAVIIYMFFIREYFSSRFIVLIAWILAVFMVIVVRVILRKIQNFALGHGWGGHHVVIIGNDKNTEEIVHELKHTPSFGYKIIGRIKEFEDKDKHDLRQLHEKSNIDEIIVADSGISRKIMVEILDFCNEHNIIFKYAAGQFESRTTNVEFHLLAGVPIIEIKKTQLDGWLKIIKRLIDILVSSIALLILWPFFIIIVCLIKLEDPGPAIYKNERVSRDGAFNVYKFRRFYTKYCTGKQFAAYTNQEAVLKYQEELIKSQSERRGPLYKVLNDPRTTVIGRFLEKNSIDELPQLFNVWLGNMSLVGPRPHQPIEVEKYEKHHKRVLDIKPGVTGLAQISGRSDLDFEEEVKLDTYYIENWSLKLDLWILLKTPFSILGRKSKV